MPSLDIFNGDAFTLQSLSAAINEQPYVPGRIGQLGLFDESGITTTTAMIEKDGLTLSLVPASERGSPGTIVKGDKRTAVPVAAVHLQENSAVMADEVQNVRSFGSESDEQVVEQIVNKRLSKLRTQLDATLEFQRVNGIQGVIKDSDGSTLLDLFTTFGLTQQSVNFVLGTNTTKIKTKILNAMDLCTDTLGAVPVSGFRVFCGKAFWEAFIEHDKVVAAHDRWMDGEYLRQDPRSAFGFGNVQWERYVGQVGANPYIADDEAYLVPEGVTQLFLTNFSPADYMETVNTIGLPYYARQERMKMDKGVELEAQSNPITLCTRPDAIIKLTTA